jgi:hypothetical protein
MMGQSKTLNNNQIMFIAFFFARAQHCYTFYQHNYAEPKCFDFFSSNFTMQDHILGTPKDTLRMINIQNNKLKHVLVSIVDMLVMFL